MKRSVLIADDEPNAREYLARLLTDQKELELVGALKNGQEVIEFCKTLQPDIVILDIEMPGISGLEAARQLSKKMDHTVFLFITAYDQYAIEAFEFATIGYLLKPFSAPDLKKVLVRATSQLETIEKALFSDRMNTLWERMEREKSNRISSFEIKEKGLIQRVPISDILYIQSSSEYVELITPKKKFLQRSSVKVLADQLPDHFHRVHRTYIVNTERIRTWKYLSDGRFQFEMSDGERITSSRSYKSDIQVWLTT